ncbi:cyclase family protein [Idiomarina loihiensis]|uniref:cyclase family protein n=1 Tax=Idiomarina loihiensis TaxID=135577 RepID=UPI00129C5F0D|nr:cyclase family protein [Idiomarina loihiensis]MRJ44043.1 cyclase family protein [Idiomarina loihiensis]UTW33831.1 cyclase family protein [Idiomarina loihiensis]
MKTIKSVLSMALATALMSASGVSLAQTSDIENLQKDMPKNWGKWGDDDQLGALNYLDEKQALRGIKAVRSGETFTLQLPITHGVGPVFPGRVPAMHFMTQDESMYSVNKLDELAGGVKYSDDAVFMYLQGTTHMDALGHAWYGDKVYGGVSADSTVHGHDHVDVGVLAEHGIVGRGVLLDVGHLKGGDIGRLAPGSCITLQDLKDTAKAQDVTVEKRDILLIRTGSVGRFYQEEPDAEWSATTEPGLCYSKDLIKWIDNMEIPVIAADNLAVELVPQKIEGKDYVIPLHGALIRDLGVVLSELYWLDDLAADSREDGQYTFMFTAAPLKMERGSGSPINPIVIK